MELSGKWTNQLGSYVTLDALEGGILVGEYHTAVSGNGKSLPPVLIRGTWQRIPDGILCGFVAQWHYMKDEKDHYSTTSWSGRIFGKSVV